jgi:tetratricopeptide (TPR) repeat protein
MMRGRVLGTGLVVLVAVALGGCQLFSGLFGGGDDEDAPAETGVKAPTEAQQQLLDEAQAARDAGQVDTAFGLFQQILMENPTIATAYVGVGDIYMIRQDYASAEPAYRRAARLEPRNYDAQYGHGLALHMLQRYTEAVRAFHRALAVDPDSVDANVAIASSYLRMDDPNSALVFAEKAVDLEPRNGTARSNLGAIYEMLGRNAEAIDEYLAAMELMPPSPPLMLNLINVLAKQRRYPEVINAAENLLKIESSANAYERMGYAYFRLSRYEDSLAAYRNAVRIDAEHWQSYNGIGVNSLNKWLLSKKRDAVAATEARDAFRRSLQLNPSQQKVISLMSNYQL